VILREGVAGDNRAIRRFQARSVFGHGGRMNHRSYAEARETYAGWEVETEAALTRLAGVPLSLHCWQGDDVGGFEHPGRGITGGGIQTTGNYPGKARTMAELRADLDQAFALIPGRHRLNLHASYADFEAAPRVDRDRLTPAHFQSWIDWSQERRLGLDFNPTFFSHPLADGGATLTHPEAGVRGFWIEHGRACRRIGAEMGRQLGSPTVTNLWIPDGSKDLPFDRRGPRARLEASLDAIFQETLAPEFHLDAVEAKLFGLGSEAYVAGSHEFYLGYAIRNRKVLCLDTGHFHPTESLADKISSVLQFVPEVLLHVSRGVRWDSDHVVILDDPTRALMEELVRGDFLSRTHLGLDFFDASINRIAAWVIGARSTLKALLLALLEPVGRLRAAEEAGDRTGRLALLEEVKTLPFGAVWAEYCRRAEVPGGADWLGEVKRYEEKVLSRRG
jgi:L-rhamnose isomerase